MVLEVDKLIELVRERPSLYDPSHAKNRDRNFVRQVWGEIASELQVTGEI